MQILKDFLGFIIVLVFTFLMGSVLVFSMCLAIGGRKYHQYKIDEMVAMLTTETILLISLLIILIILDKIKKS